MHILVTGGLGFVGINLVRALAEAGDRVICADRGAVDAAARAFLAPVAGRIIHVAADLAERGALAAAVTASVAGPIEAVVHAAAVTATTLEVERDDAGLLVATNIGGTMEALELAVAHRCRRFLYVSSPAAIGPVPDVLAPLDESVPTAPVALYGLTKLTSEGLCRRYGTLTSLSTIAARIAQPYGPLERRTATRARTSPIYEWVTDARAGRTLPTGDPTVARDWTHIADTVRGLTLLLRADAPRHDLYNVGVGRTFAIAEIITALRRAFPALQTREALPYGDRTLNPNITTGSVRGPLTITRLRDEFAFAPQYDIAAGMAQYLAWIGSREGERRQRHE